jgi:DNA-binding MarR family transcriptional regulator
MSDGVAAGDAERGETANLSGLVVGAISALIRSEHRHAAYLGLSMGLNSADTLALYHLANEPLSASALGERLGLTSGSVTALVDRLTSRKLVKRSPSRTDRRMVFIELTKTGHAASWKQLKAFIVSVEQAAASLSAAEQRTVLDFLSTLAKLTDADTEQMKSELAS